MDVLHISRPRHIGDLVALEYDLDYCRDSVTLDASVAALVPFRTVVGQQTVGVLSIAFAAEGTNTGTPTWGTASVAAGTEAGEYDLIFDDPTHFHVLTPHGEPIGTGEEAGHGVLGTAFNQGGLTFTGTAGTAAVAGDSVKVTVTAAAGDGNYFPVNASATDGTQNASGIVAVDADSTNGACPLQILARGPMIVRSAELIWPSGATTNEKNAWIAQLAALSPPIKVVTSG